MEKQYFVYILFIEFRSREPAKVNATRLFIVCDGLDIYCSLVDFDKQTKTSQQWVQNIAITIKRYGS